MKNIKKFIRWFESIGGSIDKHFEDVHNARFKPIPLPESSFKNRSEEIKEKYNHKFTRKVSHNFLEDYPDFDNIIFEKP